MKHSPDLRERLDQIADEFEAAWRAGKRPVLSAFLERHPQVDRYQLLRELLRREIELRQSAGETPSLEEYCATLHQDADIVRDVFTDTNTISLTANPAEETSAFASSQAESSDSPRRNSKEETGFLQPPQQPDEIGRLGGYRVLKVLGKGGMGVVLQAEDPQLQRQIALKTMKPSLARSRESKERFLREAQAAAALNHDHIVTIYQVGEDAGVPFIAMEFLPGESLQTRLDREQQLSQTEVVRIGREVAAGLAAAHQRGLIHRDIKPDNIWLESGRNRAKLLDFGLARAHDQDSGLTQAGAILGTPQFMSPEQANGEEADHRSDLFSLGSVLYRMAAGRAPFARNNLSATLVAVSQADCQPIGEYAPQLQQNLAALIQRLLQKERDQRPQSAAEVVQELANIERQLTTDETPAGQDQQAESSGRRANPRSAASVVESTPAIVTDTGRESYRKQG